MFLYYFPDRHRLELADLAELGLVHAFDRPGYGFGRIAKGPDGQAGVLASYGEQLGYRPDEQTWRRVPGSPAMVGYATAAPPSPESLLRADALPGRSIELGDGRPWLVPVVRSWRGDEDSAAWVLELPAAVDCDDEGRWSAAMVVSRYARLYQRCLNYFGRKVGAINQAIARATDEGADDADEPVRESFSFDDLFDLALDLLAANYRLGKAEVSMLGLLTTTLAIRIVDTAIDWPAMEAWLEKKTLRDCTATGAGSGASPPATAPPLPS